MVRKFLDSDFSAIRHLLSELAGRELSQEGAWNRLRLIRKSDSDELFVCEHENEIAGLMTFRIRENMEEVSHYGEVSAIVVDARFRKNGIGKQLMDFAEKHAREIGCKGTWLVSGFGREEEAHLFYRKLGYQTTGYRFVKRF